MNSKIAVAFGGLIVLAASAAYGQALNSFAADTGYVTGLGYAADGSARHEPSSPLFAIDGLDVHIWAPLEPHYNGEADRDPAAEPLWNAG
jgi:hypothetical protein